MVRSLRNRRTTAGSSRPLDHPITTDPAQYEGAWAYFEDGIMRYSTGTEWRSSALTPDADAEAFARITSPVTKTVGDGGDFATIGAALSYFSGFLPGATASEQLGTVNILSGTTIAEQVAMFGVNLSWVQITSEDDEVEVNLAALTDDSLRTNFPHFLFFSNGASPVIRTHFKAINSLPAAGTSIGLFLRAARYQSHANSFDGVPTEASPFDGGFEGFGENFRVAGGSSVQMSDMQLLNATVRNAIFHGSQVSLIQCLQRGTTDGVIANTGTRLTIQTCDLRLTLGEDSTSDIIQDRGAMVNISSDSLGGTSQGSRVVPTENGILYDDRSTAPLELTGLVLPEVYTLDTLPPAADYQYYFATTSDDGLVRQSNGTDWLILGQSNPGVGANWDAFGNFADRSTHDDEAAGFVYLSIDGTGDSDQSMLYVKVSNTSADWSGPIVFSGPAGPTGATGPQGATGQIGPTGPAGADGADGADGVDGKTVLNGSGAPAVELGADGDFYLDTVAIELYGPKASGNWGDPTNLTGPKGDPGAGVRPIGNLLSTGDLPASGDLGNAYIIDGDLHVWTLAEQWENLGSISIMPKAAAIETSAFTASTGMYHPCDTTGGVFTATLPASPLQGDRVAFSDPFRQWGTNNLTIARNGEPILGASEDLTCDVDGMELTFEYVGGSTGWAVGLGWRLDV